MGRGGYASPRFTFYSSAHVMRVRCSENIFAKIFVHIKALFKLIYIRVLLRVVVVVCCAR